MYSTYVCMFPFLWIVVQKEDSTDRAEIVTEVPTMPLHLVSLEEHDPIPIRAAPIRGSTILPILTNLSMIFNIVLARWTTLSTMLTMHKQF